MRTIRKCGITRTCDRHASGAIVAKPQQTMEDLVMADTPEYPQCECAFVGCSELVDMPHKICAKHWPAKPSEGVMADVGTGFLGDWHQWLRDSGLVTEGEEVVRVIVDIPLEDVVRVYVVRNALVKDTFKPPPRIRANDPTVELHVSEPQRSRPRLKGEKRNV